MPSFSGYAKKKLAATIAYMDLPDRWHPTLLKVLYAVGILLVFTTAYVAGKNAHHQAHPLLYATFALDAAVAVITLYCGNESDRRCRSTRKRTSGPCAGKGSTVGRARRAS
jgi:peptidoglycan/LPS O-acetylase OafA/YrhL